MSTLEDLRNVTKNRVESIDRRGWISYGDCYNIVLDAFFNDNDLKKMRQYSYVEGRIMEIECYKINQNPEIPVQAQHMDYHLDFSLAMLSDCLPLLQRFQALRYNNREKEFKQGWIFAYGMQCILNDDWVELERIQTIALRFAKRDQPKYQLIFPIWESLKKNDVDKIFFNILQLLKPINHRKFNDWLIIKDLVSSPALGYAKLAWLRGMEIDFNHPLIPQAMLPYQPLEVYDDEHEYIKMFKKQ